jgi:hypothetical protein
MNETGKQLPQTTKSAERLPIGLCRLFANSSTICVSRSFCVPNKYLVSSGVITCRARLVNHGGSNPPFEKGLQRQMRQTPLQPPRSGPYLLTA